MKKANYDLIWDYVIKNSIFTIGLNATSAWNIFHSVIERAIELFVPISKLYIWKRYRIGENNLWLYKRVKRLYQKSKRTRNPKALHKYCLLKNKFRSILKTNRNKFEESLIQSKNKQRIFKYIRSQNQIDCSLYLIETISGEQISNKQTIANTFNEYFQSTYIHHNTSKYIFELSSMDQVIISTTLIKTALIQMSKSNCKGLDWIPVLFWRSMPSAFLNQLSNYFNSMIRDLYIPEQWKTSIVISIYKRKESKHSVENYRPISLNNSINRIFETCIYLMVKDKFRVYLKISMVFKANVQLSLIC